MEESQTILIADSGSTKADWCLLHGGLPHYYRTSGISPYLLTETRIREILHAELVQHLPRGVHVSQIYFYGTGCAAVHHQQLIHKLLAEPFPAAQIEVHTDLVGAARAACGQSAGVVAILGTGSGLCYYEKGQIVKYRPGLGYILGDEGSGTYLGKKVLQYYLYEIFDEELREAFYERYHETREDILEKVYRQLTPNTYLASFSRFLSEHRGHYMVENILEDGLNDFFFYHVFKYKESWTCPVHFVGGVAWAYQDVLQEICILNELQIGRILHKPIEGLVAYHQAGILQS
jgi:glucosamine kinase